MTRRQPPAHYNPPPMFGLRTYWPAEPIYGGGITGAIWDQWGRGSPVDSFGSSDDPDLGAGWSVVSTPAITPRRRRGKWSSPIVAPPLTSGTDAEP